MHIKRQTKGGKRGRVGKKKGGIIPFAILGSLIHDLVKNKGKIGAGSPYGGSLPYGGSVPYGGRSGRGTPYGGRRKHHIGTGAYGGGRRRGAGLQNLFQMAKNIFTAPYRILKGVFTGKLFKKPEEPKPEEPPEEQPFQ